MLEFDGSQNEFEETFMATFQVSFSDMFGTMHSHNLKEDGDEIPVTMDNRQVRSYGAYSALLHVQYSRWCMYNYVCA